MVVFLILKQGVILLFDTAIIGNVDSFSDYEASMKGREIAATQKVSKKQIARLNNGRKQINK